MSRVSIKELYWELNEELRESDKSWKDIRDIEIVPRKMVEMIIEMCIEIQRDNDSNDDLLEIGYWGMAEEIKDYAESLLKQFEEDK